MIAQCLAAGQKTVPEGFFVHSCHCYFLLAGSSEVPIMFHVERVRDGRSFATRTVQARQRGACIFTVTMSFVRKGSGGMPHNTLRHARPFPSGETPPTDEEAARVDKELGMGGPFQHYKYKIVGDDNQIAGGLDATPPERRKALTWVRARGKIAGGTAAHLEALGYVSDSYFIGTVPRIHSVWRWPVAPEDVEHKLPEAQQRALRKACELEGVPWDVEVLKRQRRLGMMVSLDHTIYFHEPERLRTDEWMLCEMDSPWVGDGRGVVSQRIFAADGTLLATCYQEGLVRLKDDGTLDESENGEQKAKL